MLARNILSSMCHPYRVIVRVSNDAVPCYGQAAALVGPHHYLGLTTAEGRRRADKEQFKYR